MNMKGVFGIRCFREWLGLFAEDVPQSVARQKYSFSVTEECLASIRETALQELYDTARYAMDQAAMRSIGISADPAASKDSVIKNLSALKTLVEALKTKGKAAFEATTPFLREALEAKAESCRCAILEMLRRTDEHKSGIERSLLSGNHFTRLQTIRRRGSLLYSSDRIVTELVTDCGKIVYKPRDLRIDKWFLELINPYTDSFIRVPDALLCAERYGFTEYIENESVDTIKLTPENAYALGALYVMIHIARAADLNERNVFVSKGGICLLDLEIILIKEKYTEMPSSIRHLTDMFRNLICAEEASFFSGITDTYYRCMADRERLSLAVEMAGPFWVRDMIRGGGQYDTLVQIRHQLEETRSREERLADEKALTQFLRETAAESHKAFSDEELKHVLQGSSMVLTLRAGEKDAYCDGKLLRKDYISQSPVEKTKRVIDGMTERELRQIRWNLRRYINESERKEVLPCTGNRRP